MFVGLVALDEVVHHCLRDPYPRTFPLRATLAMLYALSEGDRAPFDTFWRACCIPNGEAYDSYGGRTRRVNELGGAYQQICRAVGWAETIALREDIAAARSDPGPHARAYQRLHRIDTPDTAQRRRYAEMLRLATDGRAERPAQTPQGEIS